MDIATYAVAATVIIGLVNGVQLIIDPPLAADGKKDYKPAILWVLAVVSGTVFGYLRWYGIPSLEIGFAFGVGSSGVYKLTQKIGGK